MSPLWRDEIGIYVAPHRLALTRLARGVRPKSVGTATWSNELVGDTHWSAALRAVEDKCIKEAVKLQEDVGLQAVTDGEFRRRSWSAGFIDAVDGFGLRDGTLTFRDESRVIGVAASPYAKAQLKRKRRIVAETDACEIVQPSAADELHEIEERLLPVLALEEQVA